MRIQIEVAIMEHIRTCPEQTIDSLVKEFQPVFGDVRGDVQELIDEGLVGFVRRGGDELELTRYGFALLDTQEKGFDTIFNGKLTF